MKKIRIILLTPLLFLLVSCGLNSEDTAREFMGHLYHGEHLSMQDMLGTESKKMMQMFYGSINDKTLKSYYRTNQMQSYTLHKVAETDLSARYQINIKTKTGHALTDTIDLAKEDGVWKVTKF